MFLCGLKHVRDAVVLRHEFIRKGMNGKVRSAQTNRPKNLHVREVH